MHKKIRYILFVLWIGTLPILAQETPPDLTKNAYSIVRNATTEMICDSPTSALLKESYTVTVLNEKGKGAAFFLCMCDQFTSLSKFSGEILDHAGKTVRKIKKSELQMTEYSSHLTTDDYRYYYECTIPSYPFTVKYEWEVKYKNGLISFPLFAPQGNYNQAVEKATYRLQTPGYIPCRYQTVNTQATVKQEKTPVGYLLTETSLTMLPAIEQEPYDASSNDLFPHIYFAPSQFSYDKTIGDMTTWKEYGAWLHLLMNNRGILPDPLKKKIHELTAHCTTPREKVKVIYDFLAASTRYVSIQLGIGGLQPMPATQVYQTGFGDCKGLSNYAHALLAELGIESRYTIINTNKERLLSDFASANQMNHAILQVPLPGDTLWLECTNAALPFGYIHSDIAGHDALLVGPDGGIFCRLPTYPDSLNTQTTKAKIILSPLGEAKIEAKETSYLFQYEDATYLTHLEPAKQKERLRAEINLTQASIGTLQINEKKEILPKIEIDYTVNSNQYAAKTGNRLFIPGNVFRKGFQVPDNKERTRDIYIDYGYLDTDSICIQLPEGFAIESLPRPLAISTRFGSFQTAINVENNEINLVHRLQMHKGLFPKEAYGELTEFRKKISEQYNGKIILKKE